MTGNGSPLNLTDALSERRGDETPLALESIQQILSHVAPASRELLFALLSNSREYFLLLDPGGNILWTNSTVILDFPHLQAGMSFDELLNRGARRAFRELIQGGFQDGILQVGDYELHHEVAGGVKVVSYQIVCLGEGVIALLGIDRSRELEVVAQMSVLIQELEAEVEERIRLSQILEEQATTDGLTGLMNRRHFDEVLQDEWRRWERYQSAFSLLMIDIDHFKAINDTWGHQVGDEVLRRVAASLAETVRECDLVARYGGEEFAVIGLGNEARTAVMLAERLVEAVRGVEMPGPVGQVTISVGVTTTFCNSPRNAAQLLRQADSALYRAKEAGRDRHELFAGE